MQVTNNESMDGGATETNNKKQGNEDKQQALSVALPTVVSMSHRRLVE